jgi:hypothetical protein
VGFLLLSIELSSYLTFGTRRGDSRVWDAGGQLITLYDNFSVEMEDFGGLHSKFQIFMVLMSGYY